MKLQRVILGLAVALALAVPVCAQQGPDPVFQLTNLDRVRDLNAPKPTSKQLEAERGAENPAVTAAAKSAYDQLAAGNLDRAKLTDAVSETLPAAVVQSAAQKLGALGAPSWSFVGNAKSSAGDVSVYRLQYENGFTYMTFGVSNAGIVYALYLGTNPTPTQ
ncbi:MAG TPA: hypothetical protein VK760_15580 [Candidatus Acidoferrales bacterium]|jgi:hypothetical protein|nr:hypothetical protein [Candidatus Acidoferrales bacterium]